VGSGAALKLIANTLFGVQVAAVAELLGRMPSLGLNADHAISLLGQTPVLSPAAKGAATLMLSDMHVPMFPIALVAKDFDYAIGDHADTMPVAAAAMEVFSTAASRGLNDANLTAVATLYQG
jgi:3-hydroxyisobutyrate dehydrogenase-like beta-hydroxyacid dehydrogenase